MPATQGKLRQRQRAAQGRGQLSWQYDVHRRLRDALGNVLWCGLRKQRADLLSDGRFGKARKIIDGA
jgi:hypothetical protein